MNGFRELNHNELYQIVGGDNWIRPNLPVTNWVYDQCCKVCRAVRDFVNTPVKKEWTSRSGWGPVHP